MARPNFTDGKVIAEVLAGSWRSQPPALALEAEVLEQLAPMLSESGAAGLACWRCSQSAFPAGAALPILQQAHTEQALATLIHEQRLQEVVARLRAAGVEPILVKGWSIARLYPQCGMRPCGDIDLCVAPEKLPVAMAALSAVGNRAADVDLHAGVADLDDRCWRDLFCRSHLVSFQGGSLRILSPEDQLRHLGLHFLRHGGWRPLWLCDVSTALEGAAPDFDWDYCLSGTARLTDWFVCAIGLACRMLGARLSEAPIARRAEQLPRWLEPAVLRAWSEGIQSSDNVTQPFASCLHSGANLRRALRQRWPNPIQASYRLGFRPGTRLPRWLVQLVAFFLRAKRYAARALLPAGQTAGGTRWCQRRAFQIH